MDRKQSEQTVGANGQSTRLLDQRRSSRFVDSVLVERSGDRLWSITKANEVGLEFGMDTGYGPRALPLRLLMPQEAVKWIRAADGEMLRICWMVGSGLGENSETRVTTVLKSDEEIPYLPLESDLAENRMLAVFALF